MTVTSPCGIDPVEEGRAGMKYPPLAGRKCCSVALIALRFILHPTIKRRTPPMTSTPTITDEFLAQIKTTARMTARKAVRRYGVYHTLPEGMEEAVGREVQTAVELEIISGLAELRKAERSSG